MQFDTSHLLIGILKGMWAFKKLWLLAGGVFLLALALQVVTDLLNRKSRIRWFFSKKKILDLQRLTPSEFESYTAELFRSLGYKTRVVGGVGDGGIDVEAEKDGVVHYIQCKKFITRQVPVGAVRDFYGAIADKLNGGKGYFITTNIFTLDAEKFAEGKPIELVDRFKLMDYLRLAKVDAPVGTTSSVCPKCGGRLVERSGKFGRFLGCCNYPKCSYTVKA
ncbi:restriction endonuclease [Candidatus Nomurabacteria bacterium]|nr:restriction endonuclease [Candidatus Nomurabacteria bacterium]